MAALAVQSDSGSDSHEQFLVSGGSHKLQVLTDPEKSHWWWLFKCLKLCDCIGSWCTLVTAMESVTLKPHGCLTIPCTDLQDQIPRWSIGSKERWYMYEGCDRAVRVSGESQRRSHSYSCLCSYMMNLCANMFSDPGLRYLLVVCHALAARLSSCRRLPCPAALRFRRRIGTLLSLLHVSVTFWELCLLVGQEGGGNTGTGGAIQRQEYLRLSPSSYRCPLMLRSPGFIRDLLWVCWGCQWNRLDGGE